MKRRELCDLRLPRVFIGWQIRVRNHPARPTNAGRNRKIERTQEGRDQYETDDLT
jgi:hypothetical protein